MEADWRAGLSNEARDCTALPILGEDLPSFSSELSENRPVRNVSGSTFCPTQGAPISECLPLGDASFSQSVEAADMRLGLPHDHLATNKVGRQNVAQHYSLETSDDQQKMGVFEPWDGVEPKFLQEEERREDSRVDFATSLRQSTQLSTHQPPMGKERRKVGRPIMHKGNPDDPELTERERRRIKRRIANRESARRVRNRRQEEMEEMQIKMDEVLEENRQLRQRYAEDLQERNTLAGKLEELRGRLEFAAADNQKLAVEVKALRQSLQVDMHALELDYGAAASSACTSPFGTTTVQPTSAAMMAAHPPRPTSIVMQNSGMLEMFPSRNFDGLKEMEMLPSIELNAWLESSYDPAI